MTVMEGVQQLWKGYDRYGRGTTVMEGVRQLWKGYDRYQVNMRAQGGRV